MDLGVITAEPVGGTTSDPRQRPIDQRPLSSLVGEIRGGVGSMAGDIAAAHRGPRPNSRPLPDWVRSLAWLLDDSVPLGAGRRVGLDGLISFIPGIGDAAGLVASMVVVLAGVGAGVSLPTLTLMMVHVGIDTLVGAVPFLGAVFDLGYKANTRNLGLIERDLADRAATRRSAIRVFVLSGITLLVGWLLFAAAIIGGTYMFVRLVANIV